MHKMQCISGELYIEPIELLEMLAGSEEDRLVAIAYINDNPTVKYSTYLLDNIDKDTKRELGVDDVLTSDTLKQLLVDNTTLRERNRDLCKALDQVKSESALYDEEIKPAVYRLRLEVKAFINMKKSIDIEIEKKLLKILEFTDMNSEESAENT